MLSCLCRGDPVLDAERAFCLCPEAGGIVLSDAAMVRAGDDLCEVSVTGPQCAADNYKPLPALQLDDGRLFVAHQLMHEHVAASEANLSMTHFETMWTIGQGSYGIVRAVRHRDSGRMFAVKSMASGKDSFDRKAVRQEVKVLAQLKHQNCMRFYCLLPGLGMADDTVHLLLELVQGLTLSDMVTKFALGEKVIKFYLAELLLALTYLHSIGVIHRDIKVRS